MMTKTALILVAATAVAALVSWFVDPFLVMGLFMVPALYFGVPGGIVCLILLLIARLRRKSLRPMLLVLSGIAAFELFAALVIPANQWIMSRAEEEAKDFPALTDHQLTEYRATHGRYPSSLDELTPRPAIPRLLRGCYRSDGVGYSFDFPVPGGLTDVWHYSSDTKQWWKTT